MGATPFGGGDPRRLLITLAIGLGGILLLGLLVLGGGALLGVGPLAKAATVTPTRTVTATAEPTLDPTWVANQLATATVLAAPSPTPTATPTLVMPSPLLATATLTPSPTRLTRTLAPTRRATATPTLVYTTTVRSWVAAWLAGTIAPLGFSWEEHLTDGIQASEVSLSVIAWLLPKNRQPPVAWRALAEAEVASLVTPNLPDWLRAYQPPNGYKLLWLVYPVPPSGEYLINVPKFAADGVTEWPKSSDLIRQGKVVFGLEPLKEEGGLGCGNPKLLFPLPKVTPTPTVTATLVPGVTPTSPPGPTPTSPPPPTPTSVPPTSTPVPTATSRPPATATRWVPTVTPTGAVICANPPCAPVPTNTKAPVQPTALPPATSAPASTPVPPTPPPQATPTAAPR